jgi:AraC-like DNA-binding protein
MLSFKELGPFSLILGIGAVEGLVLAAALGSRRGNARANRFLACILVFFALSIISHLFGHMSPAALEIHPKLISFFNAWNAPLVFLYAGEVHRKSGSGRRAPGMVLAAIGFFLVLLIINLALPVKSPASGFVLPMTDVLFTVSTFAFLIAALRDLAGFWKSLGPKDPARESAAWLFFLITLLMGLWAFALIIEFFFRFIEWDLPLSACSLVIILIGNYGFFRPNLFWETRGAGGGDEGNDSRPKYRKSGLPEWLGLQYRDKLLRFIEAEKPFVDPELNLRSLAQRIRIPPHHLSRVINELVGASFYEYMNSLRVEEARRLLLDPGKQDVSIAEICHAAGFNTLSTFNSSFKRLTGKTPSSFRIDSESNRKAD